MGGFFGSVIFIRPGGEGDRTAKRLFYEQRMKRHTIGSPIVKGGHVYLCVTDGFGQCYELATGKLVWEERLPTTGASGQTWATAVLVGDRLYVINQSGDTIIITRHNRTVAQLSPARTEPVHRGEHVGRGRIKAALKRGTKGRYFEVLLEDRGWSVMSLAVSDPC